MVHVDPLFVNRPMNPSSIGNGGSGADPPLGAALDPVVTPTIVSEIHMPAPI